jgi:hypothetical protein
MAIVERLEDTESMGTDAMLELLNGTWLSTTDAGPYLKLVPDEGAAVKPNWQNQVLKNDILGLLLSLRVGSFPKGYDYEFKVRCEGERCKHPIRWGTHIVDHVLSRMRTLCDESVAHLETGEPLLYNAAGAEIGFRLPTLASEVPMRKHIKQLRKRRTRKTKKETTIDRVAAQILTIGSKKVRAQQAHDFVLDLDAVDYYALRDHFDLADVQIDNELTVKCPECDWVFEVDLPLTPSFLDPTSLSRRDRYFGHLDAEEQADSKETEAKEAAD